MAFHFSNNPNQCGCFMTWCSKKPKMAEETIKTLEKTFDTWWIISLICEVLPQLVIRYSYNKSWIFCQMVVCTVVGWNRIRYQGLLNSIHLQDLDYRKKWKNFMIIFVIFLFSFLFVTFKGEWNFTFFTDMDSRILRNDFLILSFSLSALTLLYGSFRGCKAIKYILHEVRTIKRDKKNGKELTEQDMPIIGKL